MGGKTPTELEFDLNPKNLDGFSGMDYTYF